MDEFDPERRAKKVGRVLEHEYGDDAPQAVAELLADVRHYCDAHGLAFGGLEREDDTASSDLIYLRADIGGGRESAVRLTAGLGLVYEDTEFRTASREPDLARLAEIWPQLPESTRAAILTLAEAVRRG